MSTSKMPNNTPLSNQYLFSEAYLRELFSTPISPDLPAAAQKMIFEWREEYPNLGRKENLLDYLSQCLVSLGFTYTRQSSPDYFLLFADETHAQPLGICLPVANDDIGCMLKGRHYQVKMVKLLKENNLAWGIISNGSAWRLCYANSTTPYEVYLQAELDDILHPQFLDTFIQYYRFFSRNAFSFHQTTSDNSPQQGLDKLLAASETTTQLIEKHLKNRVDDVLQALCLGFVNDENTHDLQQPDLDEIYHNAIYLLYRMLFLFYAEARHLLPVDEDAYHKHSLEAIVEDVWRWQVDGWRSPDSHSLWTRLANLCGIVDIGDQEAGVNAYNGGLFSDSENPYLRKHQIKNDFLAPAIFHLAFMDTKTGLQSIEYRDLSVRHLGTLYEGMLEYRLNLVREEPVVVRESKGKRVYIKQSIAQPRKGETILQIGQVYFADDKGERKSSGSYYTPEDVVQYIISQTLLPRLEELVAPLKDLAKQAERDREIAVNLTERTQVESYADRQALVLVNEKLLHLKILDPAMGSAHFLVAAGQMLTNFIIEQLNAFEWPSDTSTDPIIWKRRVVERCLYGVDVNPLAQELAKLALWLTSASTGKPLTFLDHHIKIGDSLYGAPIERLFSFHNGLANNKTETKEPYDIFHQVYKQLLNEMLLELQEIVTSDSENIEDVKGKSEKYQRSRSIAQRLRDLADTWLAALFTFENKNGFEIKEDQYLTLLQEVVKNYTQEDWETWVVNSDIVNKARQIAREKHFFHWELEFPDAVIDLGCNFDIIIANPPYVGLSANTAISKLYQTAGCGDLYAWIFERALQVGGDNIGMVIPLSITFSRSFSKLRNLLLKQNLSLKFSSFDNIPDCLFNTSSFGGESKNKSMQRATIVIGQRAYGEKKIYSTNLLKWWAQDRPALFDNISYIDITEYCSENNIPRLGQNGLLDFWDKLRKTGRTVNDACLEILSESRRPPTNSIALTLPRAVGYFISATPGVMARNKVLSLTFNTKDDLDLIRVLLNSNVFFWYWRSFGDGFLLGVDVVGSFPIPSCPDKQYKKFAAQLDSVLEYCTTFKMYRNEKIPSYNFNKRLDLLIDIDKWIVSQVAPDLILPDEIFAQSKSNSFLRPFDLFTAPQENELEED